jgi:hypothetical protein
MPDARGGIAGAIRKKNDVSRHVRPRRATSFVRANVSKIFLRVSLGYYSAILRFNRRSFQAAGGVAHVCRR